MRVLTWSGGGPLLGHKLLVLSSYSRRGEEALWGLFSKGTNLICDVSALLT